MTATWDQTIKNSSFACDIWKSLYGSSTESLKYFEKVKNWIEIKEGGTFLEIGEISYLKMLYSTINELKDIDVDKTIAHVRVISKSIVDKIKKGGEDSVKAFLALGFCCNTIRKGSLNHIAYVFSSNEETPALIQCENGLGRCVIVGVERENAEPSFPEYCQKYKIDPNLLSVLQQFEKQGYIFREKMSNEIYFAHPIFYYASKLMLFDELKDQWECDKTILLGSHGIGALNKNVNLCTLEMLWYCIENNCNFQNSFGTCFRILKINISATKEKTFILLEQYFQKLSSNQQDILMRAITLVGPLCLI